MGASTKRLEALVRQKDEALKASQQEVDLLRQQNNRLRTEVIERKVEEETRLNEKVKELNNISK